MYDHLETFEDEVGALLQDYFDATWDQTSRLLGERIVANIIIDDYAQYWAEGLGYDAEGTFERIVDTLEALPPSDIELEIEGDER